MTSAYIADCTGMDKAYKVELIHALCLNQLNRTYPAMDPERAKNLAKIKADSLIYAVITHKEYDEIIRRVSNETR